MMYLKHILVPTDFSETAAHAVRAALTMAERVGGQVDLLHVIPDPFTEGWPLGAANLSLPSLHDEWQREAKERLDGMKPSGVAGDVVVRTGNPFVEILRCAEDIPADLIVMGTHGRGPVEHMLLGSIAEKVVRKAPCPVMTVRHPDRKPDRTEET